MKKEELKKFLDRVPADVSYSIDGSRDYTCFFGLYYNGHNYDVYSPGDYGDIYYYAKDVDEDTACDILFTNYKKHILGNIKHSYNWYNDIDSGCLLSLERFLDKEPLKIVRESDFLNVINIDNQFYSDGNFRIVFNKIPYNPYGLCNVGIFYGDKLIWDGGNVLYCRPRVKSPIISSKYNNVILKQATPTGYSIKPVIIDLFSGKLSYIYTEDNFMGLGYTGLLYSSNVAFYQDFRLLNAYRFYDIDTKQELSVRTLEDVLNLSYKWSVCPVPDCILLLTLKPKNNLILYNIKRNEVVQIGTFPVDEEKKYDFGMWFDKEKKRVIIKSFCPTEPLGKDVQCYSVYFDGPVSNRRYTQTRADMNQRYVGVPGYYEPSPSYSQYDSPGTVNRNTDTYKNTLFQRFFWRLQNLQNGKTKMKKHQNIILLFVVLSVINILAIVCN